MKNRFKSLATDNEENLDVPPPVVPMKVINEEIPTIEETTMVNEEAIPRDQVILEATTDINDMEIAREPEKRYEDIEIVVVIDNPVLCQIHW